MTDENLSRLTRLVLVLAAGFFLYDLTIDFIEGEEPAHFLVELVICTLVVTVLGAELARTVRLNAELKALDAQVGRLRGGVATQVQEQLRHWQLSQSETEIAWLIIKGFSFAEIARLRGVKEKTIRQQATSIYAKSGTANRNDFAAVFIEDLLAHPPSRNPSGSQELRRHPDVSRQARESVK